jgi:hypothetical protein
MGGLRRVECRGIGSASKHTFPPRRQHSSCNTPLEADQCHSRLMRRKIVPRKFPSIDGIIESIVAIEQFLDGDLTDKYRCPKDPFIGLCVI